MRLTKTGTIPIINYVYLIFFALFAFSVIPISIVYGDVDSPRKQMENGVEPEDVVCKKELQLMLRSNGDAICVKFSSTTRLVDFGIAEIIDTSIRETEIIEEDIEEFTEEEIVEPVTGDDETVDISPEKILIKSESPHYEPGSVIIFNGNANPNQELIVILEDPNENKVFSDILEVDSSGKVYFEVSTDASFVEGTYFLISTQSDDSEITPILLGKESDDLGAVIEKLNYELNSKAIVEIFGPSSSDVSLSILDSHSQKIFEDSIQLEENGYAEYSIDLLEYSIGAYSMVITQGTEEITKEFTIGFIEGSRPIEIALPKDSYEAGDTVLLFGKSSPNSLILIEMIDTNGEINNKIEYFTDKNGKFSYSLEIPSDGVSGEWKLRVSNQSEISEISFDVAGDVTSFTLELDQEEAYRQGDFVTIVGRGMDSLSQITIQIKSTTVIDELTVFPTSNYMFSMIWEIPATLDAGTYTIHADTGTSQATIDLIVA